MEPDGVGGVMRIWYQPHGKISHLQSVDFLAETQPRLNMAAVDIFQPTICRKPQEQHRRVLPHILVAKILVGC
jgi:hypothetical protein